MFSKQTPPSDPAPLVLYQGNVPPAWIDYNGHMNVAYYVLAFDHATDALMDYLGMDAGYRARTQCSTFVVEMHVNYQRELHAGEPFNVATQLLGFDSKRIHYFHRMMHATQDVLIATTELLLIHVDLTERRGAPMPVVILDELNALMTQHIQLPHPTQAGRVMGVRAKAAR
ncbi:MAG: thioesterase family protein [Gammaproteobacteria bacterium]|nr:thioesterase family protein [Gammaproteobacteria bacterium]MCP5458655.1 thioesterase family protein [Gammaproteobacteria bacterium]